MKPGDMVLISDYWKVNLTLVLEINPKDDLCTVLFSDGRKELFKLTFIRTLDVINNETG